ncbi:MAG TPA: hypothetical protein VF178_00935 [Gemmatimonadaceae bacterium]
MRRLMSLLAAAVFVAPLAAGAQVVRVQRPSDAWLREAPRVRVWLEHPLIAVGQPALVNLELSDDAYVMVGHVDRTGRLTILYPQGPTRRSHLAGGMVHRIRGRFQSNAAFFATEFGSGYVFAIASYSPLDLTGFEDRDFRPGWAYSRFTLATQSLAPDPNEYVTALAAALLWDDGVPYEYDVEFYNAGAPGFSPYVSALALCNPELRLYLRDAALPGGLGLSGMCRDFYLQVQCLSYSALRYSPYTGACLRYAPSRRYYTYNQLPPTPSPADTAGGPNERVIRNGLWRPDTARRNAETATYGEMHLVRDTKSAAETWDRFYAIPDLAKRKLKGEQTTSATTNPTVRTRDDDDDRSPTMTTGRRTYDRSTPSRATTANREPARVDAQAPTRRRYSDRDRTSPRSKPARASSGSSSSVVRPAARPASSGNTIRATKPAPSKPKSSGSSSDKPKSNGSSSKTKPPA